MPPRRQRRSAVRRAEPTRGARQRVEEPKEFTGDVVSDVEDDVKPSAKKDLAAPVAGKRPRRNVPCPTYTEEKTTGGSVSPPKKQKRRFRRPTASPTPEESESPIPGSGKEPFVVKRNENGKLLCPVCGQETRNLRDLERHLYTHTDVKQFECPECKVQFTRKYHLTRHLAGACAAKADPGITSNLTCCICGKIFARKDSLREHLRFHAGQTKTNKRKNECDVCKKVIVGSSSSLKIHMRIHSGEKPFRCEVCDKSFISKPVLRKHTRTHTGERPYNCNQCDQKFKTKEAVNRHRLTHTESKPHVCLHCGKSFIQPLQLKQHMFYHTGENGFKCPQCNKVFNRKSRLKLHISYVHDNYRPFKCDACDRQFVRKTDLNRHKVFHTGVKAHACPICEKAFALGFSLNAHIRYVHESSRACEVCDKVFKRSDVYVRHMRKNHGEILDRVVEEARKAAVIVRADNEKKGLNPSEKEVAAMALLHAVKNLEALSVDTESEEEDDENTDEEEEQRREKEKESRRRHTAKIALRAISKCLTAETDSEDEGDEVRSLLKRTKQRGVSVSVSAEVALQSSGPSTLCADASGANEVRGVCDDDLYVIIKQEPSSETPAVEEELDDADIAAFEDGEGGVAGSDVYCSDLEEEEGELLDDDDLQSAIMELMTVLIEDETLAELGWPHASCDELLKSVIRQCGQAPVDEDLTEDLSMRLRHNAILLFSTVVDCSDEMLLQNKSVDEIILHVLQNAKAQSEA